MAAPIASVLGLGPRTTSALLWGAVGALAFLVLVQGYALVAAPLVTIVQAFAIAAVVGIVATVGTYVLEPRIATRAANGSARDTESHDRGDGKSKS
ncbi:hypothetical protein [Halopiger xanaduensis]|uniref:DUF7981 domain-containing protein n=1 Tax=Halopiger xanaduensis (strain DSM 18323 / JCM 14033 / SH-6) TaxID=797210 RepID=F8D741_HALXS|nr:hypothetical protein [Halopiger xanaduensis]AEH36605.1 hypothetical protein Halxa_1980 [Halopiger xanaduensis SH-6]